MALLVQHGTLDQQFSHLKYMGRKITMNKEQQMGKKVLLGFLITALILFLGVPGFAQESTVKGNLAGMVVDASGAIVQGATVTLIGPTGTRTTKTDVDGKFTFPTLSPGLYAVKV